MGIDTLNCHSYNLLYGALNSNAYHLSLQLIWRRRRVKAQGSQLVV